MNAVPTSDVTRAFDDAGLEGWLHAVDLDSGATVDWRGAEPVVAASVFKLPLLVELFRQAEAGELDPAEQVTVDVTGRTIGPFGLSVMRDPVTMSLRDLAWLMIAVSDNAATDVLAARVGLDRVQSTVDSLGLTGTHVPVDCAGIFATMVEDAGLTSVSEWPATIDAALAARLRALDPASTVRTTPQDMSRLLELVWTDRAAGPDACAEVRRILGGQVWPHRLAAGFPEDDVRTSGKTGTLPGIRNEVGVVETAVGERYAVAVFTRSARLGPKDAAADAAIGRAARAAVDALRSCASG